MATIPNPKTNYDELDEAILASKSGKTPYDAEILRVLKQLVAALTVLGGTAQRRVGKDA